MITKYEKPDEKGKSEDRRRERCGEEPTVYKVKAAIQGDSVECSGRIERWRCGVSFHSQNKASVLPRPWCGQQKPRL